MNRNLKVDNPMKVITVPDTRWSYANIWKPKSINGGIPKYSVALIIPKSSTKTIAQIEVAIEAAYKQGPSRLTGNSKSVPDLSISKTPHRNGNIERPDNPAYANVYFMNTNAISAPDILDADHSLILACSEVYSGAYGRPASTSTFLTTLTIRGLPMDDLRVCKRSVTVSPFIVSQVLNLILHLMKMTLSLINEGATVEMLQTVLVIVLLTIGLLFSIVFLITAIQNLINEHKHEIRKQERSKRYLGHHKARMREHNK